MSKAITMIGLIMLTLGVSCADSECLLIPTVSVIIGALLMYFGNKKNIES